MKAKQTQQLAWLALGFGLATVVAVGIYGRWLERPLDAITEEIEIPEPVVEFKALKPKKSSGTGGKAKKAKHIHIEHDLQHPGINTGFDSGLN
jgi:hypothetical protein